MYLPFFVTVLSFNTSFTSIKWTRNKRLEFDIQVSNSYFALGIDHDLEFYVCLNKKPLNKLPTCVAAAQLLNAAVVYNCLDRLFAQLLI